MSKVEFKDKYEKIVSDIEKVVSKAALIHSNSETASTGGLNGGVKRKI